ncbi:response regulator transcription factor [Fulvivirga sp. 29W222]|uniref:Response regulator transcription factor n=1 Tax=Fulvivirga marina TaxID=2494733 RepID=A0A937FYZ1_9BACT|nr:response regulator transcription factor [Fulvivirga marina]MBL6447066.1 response regulator transcription factor [Fulvivirga marina]
MNNIRSAKIMLVEDDTMVALELINRLKRFGHFDVITYDTGEEAISKFTEDRPDIVIMDIKLAGELDGVSTAERLHQLRKVPTIFLTDHANPEVMHRISFLDIVNFLVKPFVDSLVMQSIDKALAVTEKSDTVFMPLKEGRYEKMAIKDITYLEADGSYCTIHCTHGKKLVNHSKNMKVVHGLIIQSASQPEKFVKIHKSYIVNKDHITGIQGNQLIMDGDEKVNIGKSFQAKVKAMLNML